MGLYSLENALSLLSVSEDRPLGNEALYFRECLMFDQVDGLQGSSFPVGGLQAMFLWSSANSCFWQELVAEAEESCFCLVPASEAESTLQVGPRSWGMVLRVNFVLSLCWTPFSCEKKNIHQDESHTIHQLLRLSVPEYALRRKRGCGVLGSYIEGALSVLGDLETSGLSQLWQRKEADFLSRPEDVLLGSSPWKPSASENCARPGYCSWEGWPPR